MAHIMPSNGDINETSIQKRGGHASPNIPTTTNDFPDVPAGPAQGALPPDPGNKTNNPDNAAQD